MSRRETALKTLRMTVRFRTTLISFKVHRIYVRIKFENKNPTEWFNLKEKYMDKFLKYCDEVVSVDAPYPPVYGTEFTTGTSKRVDFPDQPMIVGVEANKRGVPKRKQKYRRQARSMHATNVCGRPPSG